MYKSDIGIIWTVNTEHENYLLRKNCLKYAIADSDQNFECKQQHSDHVNYQDFRETGPWSAKRRLCTKNEKTKCRL